MQDGLILMIPGPTYVRKKVLEKCASPVWGHRDSAETEKRLKPIHENLRRLMEVDESYEIIISSSSGTGLMEAAIRNCVYQDDCVLNVSIGAFGDLFNEITIKNGKQGIKLGYAPGQAVNADELELWLEKPYGALTITHNETSTGTMNNLKELSKVIRKFDTLFVVDAVSSFGGVRIPVQELGIDVLVASSQKCLALPPGLAVGAVSHRAMERAIDNKHRGLYFDFVEFAKSNKKYQTPTTPNSPLIDALNYQLDYIVNKEGIENRFSRHKKMSDMVKEWAAEIVFPLLPEEGYESTTVSCLVHPPELDKKTIKVEMRNRGYLMDTGYRKLEDAGLHTFRIPTMGDVPEEMLASYLSHMKEQILQHLHQ